MKIYLSHFVITTFLGLLLPAVVVASSENAASMITDTAHAAGIVPGKDNRLRRLGGRKKSIAPVASSEDASAVATPDITDATVIVSDGDARRRRLGGRKKSIAPAASSEDATIGAIDTPDAADIFPDREGRRRLRKNCSHMFSTGSTYKICIVDDYTQCIKMTSTTNADVYTYDSSDDGFHFKVIEVTVSGKDRVRLENQEFDHNLAANDFSGNDGATAFKISQSSGPCATNSNVKISYLDPDGIANNDYLRRRSGNLSWTAKSGNGTKFRFFSV